MNLSLKYCKVRGNIRYRILVSNILISYHTFVSNDLSLTSAELAIKHGSESSHVIGTVAAWSAYTNKSK
jgi:hypothetical protein